MRQDTKFASHMYMCKAYCYQTHNDCEDKQYCMSVYSCTVIISEMSEAEYV